nr:band 7 protein AGAP004871-like [Drosophila takahashii]
MQKKSKEGAVQYEKSDKVEPSPADIKTRIVEKFAVFLSWFLVVIFFPFSLCCCVKVVVEYQRIVIFRLGHVRCSAGPGLVFILPCIDSFKTVNIFTDVIDVGDQDMLTKDSVSITVNAAVFHYVFNPIDWFIKVDGGNDAVKTISQVTLRNIVGSKNLHEILASRQQLSREIQAALADFTSRWGVYVERVDLMNIELPSSLERSLASEAEAIREARAKIILAEGELKASKALKEASDVMCGNKITLQLRHLQILSSIATERRVRIIYPIPLEIMAPFMSDKENQKDGGDDGDDNSKKTRKEDGRGSGAGGSKDIQKEGSAYGGGGVLSNFIFSGKEETTQNTKEDAKPKDTNEPGETKGPNNAAVINIAIGESRNTRKGEKSQRPTYVAYEIMKNL